MAGGTSPTSQEVVSTEIVGAFDGLWVVVVHDDDVTTFQTVIQALQELFNHSRKVAESLTWKVHLSGSAEVAVGSREFAVDSVARLRGRRISASAEPVR